MNNSQFSRRRFQGGWGRSSCSCGRCGILIIESERKKYVRYEKEVIISQINQIEELNSDEKE